MLQLLIIFLLSYRNLKFIQHISLLYQQLFSIAFAIRKILMLIHINLKYQMYMLLNHLRNFIKDQNLNKFMIYLKEVMV